MRWLWMLWTGRCWRCLHRFNERFVWADGSRYCWPCYNGHNTLDARVLILDPRR
jgi:hypothetical protein